ncbi:iron-sulfur cluster assembly scaffold protein [Mycoplasma sp. ATU-Cv-703]|uniref:iron-sulfur cluster assembly scaffold protein n=1 Tax=Mycoplasma sp. ATU-Cv-703 TaxID=2498595 RepID=UPI000FDDA4FA
MNWYSDPNERRKILMDRYLHPRFQGTLAGVKSRTYQAEHCADKITLVLKTDAGKIKKALFSGHGCVIAIASSDMVLEKVVGLNLSEACQWMSQYRQMIQLLPYPREKMGQANVLSKVGRHLNRQGCALLIYEALHDTLGCQI